MKVGYIGLGALGSQLARRFLQDHELCVWDLSPAACAAIQAEGAEVASSAADLARRCECVLICLPRSSDVRQVVFGPEGLAAGSSPGQLVIDQTSGMPGESAQIARELARRGVHMIDAAVSASPHVVPQGGATLMVGGPDEVVERALPILRTITAAVVRCGSRVGDGQATKTVNNAVNGAIRMGTLEVTALARKAGLSLKDLCTALNAGTAHNQTTDKMLPALLEGRTSTNFALALMLKDLNQGVSLGLQCGVPMPVSAATRGLMQAGLNALGEGARLEDMVGVIESMAGTRIAGPQDDSRKAPEETMTLIDSAIAALCRAATLECVAAGLKFGLSLHVMRDVLVRSSGWSAAGRLLLSALTGEQAQPRESLQHWVKNLRGTAELAASCGAPVLVLAAARSLYEGAAARFGEQADHAAVITFCEELSGVRFRGAGPLDQGDRT
jgi:3-hydroxyisobutyrate dehydrogenase